MDELLQQYHQASIQEKKAKNLKKELKERMLSEYPDGYESILFEMNVTKTPKLKIKSDVSNDGLIERLSQYNDRVLLYAVKQRNNSLAKEFSDILPEDMIEQDEVLRVVVKKL